MSVIAPARPLRLLRARGLRLLLILLLPGLLLCLLLTQPRLIEYGWFSLQQWLWPQAHAHSLQLASYRADIQAQPLAGVPDDVSALTFDPVRRSLFTLTNQNPELIELSLDGQVLRRIALHGFADPEAVEYVAPGLFVIVDERRQSLVAVRLDDDTRMLHASSAESLTLALQLNGNKGFEGLAWDAARQRLLVAKERDPLRIYEVSGFPRLDAERLLSVQIHEDPVRDAALFMRDLSSLSVEPRSGHLLALSDESYLLLELDLAGQPLSSLSLRAGRHGLQASVPQAEGMTVDDQGNVYVVSEPNLFYRFRPPQD